MTCRVCYAVVSPDWIFSMVWSREGFTLLHLQQKDEMTWIHQWWDFVRYPWVDLTGFMVLIIYISFLLVTYSFLEVMCNMYNSLALKDDPFVALYILLSGATLIEKQLSK